MILVKGINNKNITMERLQEWECPYCGITFNEYDKLVSHVATHTNRIKIAISWR